MNIDAPNDAEPSADATKPGAPSERQTNDGATTSAEPERTTEVHSSTAELPAPMGHAPVEEKLSSPTQGLETTDTTQDTDAAPLDPASLKVILQNEPRPDSADHDWQELNPEIFKKYLTNGEAPVKARWPIIPISNRNRRYFEDLGVDLSAVAYAAQSSTWTSSIADINCVVSRDTRAASVLLAAQVEDPAFMWMERPAEAQGVPPTRWSDFAQAIASSLDGVAAPPVLAVECPPIDMADSQMARSLIPKSLRELAKQRQLKIILVLTGAAAHDAVVKQGLPQPFALAEAAFLDRVAIQLGLLDPDLGPETLEAQLQRGLWGQHDWREALDVMTTDPASFAGLLEERAKADSQVKLYRELDQLFTSHVVTFSPQYATALFAGAYLNGITERAFNGIASAMMARWREAAEEPHRSAIPATIDDATMSACRISVRTSPGRPARIQPRDGESASAELRRLFARKGRQARRKLIDALIASNPLRFASSDALTAIADLLVEDMVSSDLILGPEVSGIIRAATLGNGEMPMRGASLNYERAQRATLLARMSAKLVHSLSFQDPVDGPAKARRVMLTGLLSHDRSPQSAPGDAAWEGGHACAGIILSSPDFAAARSYTVMLAKMLADADDPGLQRAVLQGFETADLRNEPSLAGLMVGLCDASIGQSSDEADFGLRAFWLMLSRLLGAEAKDGECEKLISLAQALSVEDATLTSRGFWALAAHPRVRNDPRGYYNREVEFADRSPPMPFEIADARESGHSPTILRPAIALFGATRTALSNLAGGPPPTEIDALMTDWTGDLIGREILAVGTPLLWIRRHPWRKSNAVGGAVRGYFKKPDSVIDQLISALPFLALARWNRATQGACASLVPTSKDQRGLIRQGLSDAAACLKEEIARLKGASSSALSGQARELVREQLVLARDDIDQLVSKAKDTLNSA